MRTESCHWTLTFLTWTWFSYILPGIWLWLWWFYTTHRVSEVRYGTEPVVGWVLLRDTTFPGRLWNDRTMVLSRFLICTVTLLLFFYSWRTFCQILWMNLISCVRGHFSRNCFGSWSIGLVRVKAVFESCDASGYEWTTVGLGVGPALKGWAGFIDW